MSRHHLVNGKYRSTADVARAAGLKPGTVRARLAAGEAIEEALRPVQPKRSPSDIAPGSVFGRLTVVELQAEREHGERMYVCRCGCIDYKIADAWESFSKYGNRYFPPGGIRLQIEKIEASSRRLHIYPGRKLLSGAAKSCGRCTNPYSRSYVSDDGIAKARASLAEAKRVATAEQQPQTEPAAAE